MGRKLTTRTLSSGSKKGAIPTTYTQSTQENSEKKSQVGEDGPITIILQINSTDVESSVSKQDIKKGKAGSKDVVAVEEKKDADKEVSKSENDSKIDTESREESFTDGIVKEIIKKNEGSGKSGKQSMTVSEWVCGDLVWAQISGHPFWPGIVTVDPALGQFEKTKKGRGESLLRDYHIQFFGDKGSHCWVSAGRILKFEGESIMRDLVLTKKKDKRFSSAIPDRKGSILLKWNCAVKEANEAVLQSRKERIEYFEEYYPVKISVKQQTELAKKNGVSSSSSNQQDKEEMKVKSKKRGRTAQKAHDGENDRNGSSTKNEKVSVEGSPSNNKKAKKESEESDSQADEQQDELKKDNEPNSDDEFANDEGKKKRKRKKATVKPPRKTKYKRKEKLHPGDFEVFFEKSAAHCVEINSKFENDEEGLRKYLKKMWEVMNDEEKSKFGEYPVTSS